jgi:hypothetical protein
MPLRDHHDTLDAGPRNIAPGSHRRCAVSGEVKPVEEMIRFVIGPDHAPFVDLKRRLPGRGLWITATRQALELAIRRKVFERSFVRDIRLSHDFLQRTEHAIERAALDALAIAHKAGKVAIGSGRSKPRSPTQPWWAFFTPRKRPPMASTSSKRRLAAARISRLCGRSTRRNWIWHWDGQM